MCRVPRYAHEHGGQPLKIVVGDWQVVFLPSGSVSRFRMHSHSASTPAQLPPPPPSRIHPLYAVHPFQRYGFPLPSSSLPHSPGAPPPLPSYDHAGLPYDNLSTSSGQAPVPISQDGYYYVHNLPFRPLYPDTHGSAGYHHPAESHPSSSAYPFDPRIHYPGLTPPIQHFPSFHVQRAPRMESQPAVRLRSPSMRTRRYFNDSPRSLTEHMTEEELQSDIHDLKHEIEIVRLQIALLQNSSRRLETLTFGHDWDFFDPDFLLSDSPSPPDNVKVETPQEKENLLNLLWSVFPADQSSVDTKSTEAEDPPLDAQVKVAYSLLERIGTASHRPKIELYAQAIMNEGIIRMVNDEFVTLMGGTREELFGRNIRDFIPPIFSYWYSHVLETELLCSESSSMIFETVMSRLDGTLFRCIFNFSLFRIDEEHLFQTVCTIHLHSVHDLKIPAYGRPLPRHGLESSLSSS